MNENVIMLHKYFRCDLYLAYVCVICAIKAGILLSLLASF